jgi:hypothetical protein
MSKTMAVLDDAGTVTNIVIFQDIEPETETLITYTAENPAFIGGDYVEGFFYPPQPFPSWTRDHGTWQPPVAYPDDGEAYTWDEDEQTWRPIETGDE